MRYSSGDRRPHLKPVQKIELSDRHLKLRTALVVVCLVIGLGALAVFLFSLLETEPGWQTVEVQSDKPNSMKDFTFQYDLSDQGGSSTAVFKKVSQVYQQASEDAYVLFSKDQGSEQQNNLRFVNTHVNETVTVDPALYEAFALVARYDSRYLYLAPLYAEYRSLCLSESDGTAARYDPARDPDAAAYAEKILEFISDPAHIRLELLENHQVCLHVSPDYLAFAEELDVEAFLDFDWMTNAFIADYVADALTENGFRSGFLSSFDGFTRTLDDRGTVYSLNLFDLRPDAIYGAGRVDYTGPASLVSMRRFALSDRDRFRYYGWEDGKVSAPYVNPDTGRNESAMDDLVGISRDSGCAEMLLQMLPVYFGTEQDKSVPAQAGTYLIWTEDLTVFYQDPAIRIQDLYETDALRYTAELVQ